MFCSGPVSTLQSSSVHFFECKFTVVVATILALSVCLSLQVISKSSEEVGDASTEEKYLIATSEQPLCALHR